MDFYGADRKLSEMGDRDFTDFLDNDMFTSADSGMELGLDSINDNEWLDSFFTDPVLNDRMISEAVQPQRVQSEHSYSLSENADMEPLNLKMNSLDKDLEPDLLVNPDMTISPPTSSVTVKQEPADTYISTVAARPVTVTKTSPPQQTLLKPPTIILATQQQQQQSYVAANSLLPSSLVHVKTEPSVVPRVNIKLEPGCPSPYHMTMPHSSLPSPDTASNASSPEHSVYDSIGLPPTPPSSGSSDSEGGLSPQRSCSASPMRGQTPLARQQAQLRALSQPLFTTPIPTSGVLILTEEEKRTLISEGYPIPTKLPLTKQEEKNLKKIRRKIKNKISAQESRRKKKEYMETLEKRMEAFSQENTDLKRKVDNLENNNRSLLSQLQKLQSLVSKVPRPMAPASTQTGTCLMVLALFFAVFLGTWSPASLSVAPFFSSSSPSSALNMAVAPNGPHQMGPDVKEVVVDPYATPSIKSRVLMSVSEEGEWDRAPPFSYHDLFQRFFSFCSLETPSAAAIPAAAAAVMPEQQLPAADPVVAYADHVTTVAANHNTTS